MSLHPPKKNLKDGGYHLAITPPVTAPRLKCTDTEWLPTDEWDAWAANQRQQLIGTLLSHGNWFSRPPRRDVIEPLFAPWISKSMQGALKFFSKIPDVPKAGSAAWQLAGLTMTSAAITPVWTVSDFVEEPEQDTISLFGDADTIDGNDENDEQLTREIQFEEIEPASPAAAPTKMRNREWEATKFLAKERVREARLKAQIADRLAAKEESRFYAKYGDLEDDESHFSEYDLTEDEADSTDSDQP